MKVKTIAVTKPLIEGIVTAEDLTVYIARVSNPQNQLNIETGSKLINYCINKQHNSIFEHSYLTVEVMTSRAVSAQLLRHRSFVFQEFSQRYSSPNEFELVEPRKQDTKNRQNSTNDLPAKDEDWFMNALIGVNTTAKALYDEAIRRNVAKESARFLLPMGVQTTLYITGNIRSWMHYILLRTSIETQFEHRQVALAIKDVFMEQFPIVSEALGWINNNEKSP